VVTGVGSMKKSGLMAVEASVALAFVALAVTACNPPHPPAKAPLKVISTLDCPKTEGDLNRQSIAGDGKSCVYTGGGDTQVTLTLVALDGQDSRLALEPIEAQLKAEVPAVTAGAPPKTPPPGGAATHAVAEKNKDKVDIDLPGLHIHTNGGGATVSDVESHNGNDHDSDNANVRVGGDGEGVNINAGHGGAQIRIDERGSGIRARFILASDTAGPHGYKVVGYEARGPKEGPIVVATLMTKSDDHDAMRHDIHKLLRRNVGG
jgi:hypothetical protein